MTDNALKTPISTTITSSGDRRSNNFQQLMSKAIPCHVTAIDKDFVTVAFEPQNGVWTLPTIKIPQSFSRYARDPTQVGDEGYAVPSDYNTGGLTGLGTGVPDFYPKGNLTPLSFQPLSRTSNEDRDYDQYTITGGPHGVKIIQSPQKPKEDPPPGNGNPAPSRRQLRTMGSRTRAAWLKARTPVKMNMGADISASASLIPMTTINIDQLGNFAVNALKGITHISDNLMPLSGLPTSMSGILHMAGGAISHIADNALKGALPPQAQGILHLAEQAITHTSLSGNVTHSAMNGLINMVVKQGMNIGAPSSSETFDATTPPQPTQPTIVNVLGSMMASVSMSAGASMSAPSISADNMTCGGWGVPTGSHTVIDPIPENLLAALVALNLINDQSVNHWKPINVTGSRGGNTALASLLTAMASQGFITDGTGS